MPPITPILRASLPATRPSPGFRSFSLPCKKLVLEYCESWGSSEGIRRLLLSSSSTTTKESGIAKLARENPGVEFVVRRRPHRHPVVRGLYLNNRDKVICVRNLQPTGIQSKIQLLLDSSGEKLRLEKGHPVKSTTESVRGIYSPFHTPYKGENLGKLR